MQRYIVVVQYVVERHGSRVTALDEQPREAPTWEEAQHAVLADIREREQHRLRQVVSIRTYEEPRA